MHYGTFRLGDDGEVEPVNDLRAALAGKGNPPVLAIEHERAVDVP